MIKKNPHFILKVGIKSIKGKSYFIFMTLFARSPVILIILHSRRAFNMFLTLPSALIYFLLAAKES